jgi:hypothetical protein
MQIYRARGSRGVSRETLIGTDNLAKPRRATPERLSALNVYLRPAPPGAQERYTLEHQLQAGPRVSLLCYDSVIIKPPKTSHIQIITAIFSASLIIPAPGKIDGRVDVGCKI